MVGLYSIEQQIMDAWDDGASIERIARQTGRRKGYVAEIVGRYRYRDDETATYEKARAGSAQLLAAIQRAGLC